ncbi:hypothetical protein GCM10009718_36990 [Isoptericola halotolerans]|uniref:Uncharacterized protein n=1 Tax=Isoptericola halotolerans TaxID=300560 RepID=A0ABX2A6G1_9MICO|nr:hypothetical protein [Isoptericola halotolerans]NOV98229.1 hypothetical protein [Isoptericola halotolerans]
MLIDQWQGFTGLPDYGDVSNIPTHLQGAFNFLGDRAVPRYASPAARDAELPSPTVGQMAWVGSPAALQVYDGVGTPPWKTVWQPEDPWHNLTYTNGWGGTGRYRRDSAGNLHVQARLTTVGTSSTGAQPAFALPEGYHHTLSTFLRLPAGVNSFTLGADAYFYNDGRVTISHNDPGYVSINEVLSLR